VGSREQLLQATKSIDRLHAATLHAATLECLKSERPNARPKVRRNALLAKTTRWRNQ
jgi:hypothetical protein